jgi:UDP-N-acetylglucosamine--N-acetylmuramyl-(pentapeptide) pyrophosphoryl-undecaprenol N-acetylglucosamine transferase
MPERFKTFKILFTGGGTAGHLCPIIAIVRELRRLDFRAEFYYIGPKDEFVDLLLSHEGIKAKTILTGKIRRYVGFGSILQNIKDILFKIPLGFLQAFFMVFLLNPDLTFSKGGYGSLAAVFWSWFFRSPVFLHESDIVPGMANRFTNRLALEVFISFPVPQTEYFPLEKMISVGNPIRKEIIAGTLEEAKQLFYLKGGKRGTLLILGGSQGAQKINDLILQILPRLLADFELIHQTGEQNFQEVSAEARAIITKELVAYYHPIPFLKEIETKHAYAAADLIISRAGSGAIFEIAACKKASILIPLATAAQDHQAKNAYAYAMSGAAIVIEEANLTPSFFLEKIKFLFSRPEELDKMRQATGIFARPDSARIIASYIAEYLK